MVIFEIIAVLITLAALFSYVNYKLLKLPATIGLMALALAFSAVLIAAGQFYPPIAEKAHELVLLVDFNETLMHGMLGFLLFAGALHVNLSDL